MGARRRTTAARLGTGLSLLVLAALAAVALWRHALLLRISDLWPADLSRPGGWLIDRQLADLRGDPGLCRRVLVAPEINARPVADAASKPGCGWSNAVEAATVGGARIAASPVTCELAAALALWMTHVVQPKAVELLGSRVAAVDHLGGFACRNIRGSPAFANYPSQHASANALDVTGFRLADGRRIRIVSEWGQDGPAGRFLADIQKEGCRYFRVAIGPDYNAAHRDHFHLDRGRWRACR
jgi:hypothetical protein